jgi:hypothetical protein
MDRSEEEMIIDARIDRYVIEEKKKKETTKAKYHSIVCDILDYIFDKYLLELMYEMEINKSNDESENKEVLDDSYNESDNGFEEQMKTKTSYILTFNELGIGAYNDIERKKILAYIKKGLIKPADDVQIEFIETCAKKPTCINCTGCAIKVTAGKNII